MSPQRLELPSRVAELKDNECHYVCCVDDFASLCGVEADGTTDDTAAVSCVVCLDLDRADFCPRGLSCGPGVP